MSFFPWLMGLLFPEKCPFCQRILEDEYLLCEKCLEEIKENENRERQWYIGQELCCIAPFRYGNKIEEAVIRYKFSGARYYAPCFGSFMADMLEDTSSYDVVTWVPLHRKKLRKRGYNQAKLLAYVVAEETGIEVVSLLEKWKENQQQSTIEDDQTRRENTEGVYRMLSTEFEIENKRILLVDDIITTGSTLLSCQNVLIQAGAKSVTCLGFARSRK